MRSLFIALLVLMPMAASARPCPVTEQSLRGAWERKSAAGFFEEMSFEVEGKRKIFNSWLHHRPEMSGGTWELANCTILIADSTINAFSFEFAVIKVSKNRIYLRESDEKDIAVYQRIK